MRNSFRVILVICAFCIVLSGCDKISGFFKGSKGEKPKKEAGPVTVVEVKGTPIAKVNNLTITLEELNKQVDIYNASLDFMNLSEEQKKEARIDNRDKKISYLKNVLVRQMVFYQAALDRGLDRREDIQEVLQRDKIAILANEIQRELTKDIDVSSAEIEQTYKSLKEQLKEPEARKIREIALRTEDEAKQVLIELLKGTDFVVMVKERSVVESAKKEGDLGYLKKGERGEKYLTYDEVAFSPGLQQGSVSSVFKGSDGYYYIVKIEGVKEGKEISMSEVWDKLKELLLVRKRNEELEKVYGQLSSNTKLEFSEKEVK